ncbi:MAG TPA: hypothetical protein VHA82_24870 [Ramlibacter sp.]|uniref:hypothetical protein n=1 Tax=Ramlibacter sp. TaxID=1917967 RepID=UPI002CF6EB5C|nr:hypothetical protein [Ramlibacter sp.]HVZ47064.1 hypothetical protein [Ramlibacter sp.]
MVEGNASTAMGGDAGDTVIGPGGSGGLARVVGDRSHAFGGRGGRGGVGSGGPGGDAEVLGDDSSCYGGNGGEANQRDGRGGRGGTPHKAVFDMMGLPYRDMKLPYWAPNLIPGRGGDAGDSPQHIARRLIVEELKLRYFAASGVTYDRMDVWFDREIVPLAWLNAQLRADGHEWSAAIVDQEYECSDMVR